MKAELEKDIFSMVVEELGWALNKCITTHIRKVSSSESIKYR